MSGILNSISLTFSKFIKLAYSNFRERENIMYTDFVNVEISMRCSGVTPDIAGIDLETAERAAIEGG